MKSVRIALWPRKIARPLAIKMRDLLIQATGFDFSISRANLYSEGLSFSVFDHEKRLVADIDELFFENKVIIRIFDEAFWPPAREALDDLRRKAIIPKGFVSVILL